MTIEHTIGPRQTVDRACHPTLGEGRAVYDNGPAFFLPDVGEPVAMRSIGGGGSQSKPTRRSWLTARAIDGRAIELDTTDRARGERHYRRWHPTHGPGWYVSGGKMGHDRWESDNGTTLPLEWSECRVGRPRKGKTKEEKAEDDHWWTVTLRSGEVFSYRSEAPFACEVEPGASPVRAKAPTLTPLQRGRAGFPPPNATRAEIDAWVSHTNRSLP